MEQNQCLVIVLPEEMAELPIQIIKGKQVHNELVLKAVGLQDVPVPDVGIKKKYALIWQKELYAKIMLDDILWIQADHGYSDLILKNGRKMTVSFNLAFVGRWLPTFCFMRIHKSDMRRKGAMTSCRKESDISGEWLSEYGFLYLCTR